MCDHLTLSGSAVTYRLVIKHLGPTGPAGASWLWGYVPVADAVDIVYSPLFRQDIAPIIFINGVPFKWAALGIVQNKKDQPGEEAQTPYLDFTGYAIGEGVITGDIDFQYLSL
jgi:hypothetical protein